MGALNEDRMSPRDNKRWPLESPGMAKLVSPDSSFSSTSSFCEKIAAPHSPPRLRRSTVDLSQIKSSSRLRSVSSLQRQELTMGEASKEARTMISGGNQHVEDFVKDTVFHLISLVRTIVLVEAGMRTIIGEAQHHVGKVLGFLFKSIFGIPTNDASHHSRHGAEGEDFDDPPPDPLLSPARVTRTPNSDSKDEWGHFADFQEELADDKSFLPSCIPKTSSLETLEEDDDFEGDTDAFSF